MNNFDWYALEKNAKERNNIIESAKCACRIAARKIGVEHRITKMGDPLEDLVDMYQSITRDDNVVMEDGDGSDQDRHEVVLHNHAVHMSWHFPIRARHEYTALVRYLEANGHWNTLDTFHDELRQRESAGQYPYPPMESDQLDQFQVENL